MKYLYFLLIKYIKDIIKKKLYNYILYYYKYKIEIKNSKL